MTLRLTGMLLLLAGVVLLCIGIGEHVVPLVVVGAILMLAALLLSVVNIRRYSRRVRSNLGRPAD